MVLMENGSLMKVEVLQNAPIGAFYNTFDLHKATIVIETHFSVLFEWQLKTGFTVHATQKLRTFALLTELWQ